MVVIGAKPTPPGANVPAFSSNPVAPRSTIEPELNSPPAELWNRLVPAPSVTLPVTVPELLTVSLPVLPTMAMALRLERIALDPIFSKLARPPSNATRPLLPVKVPLSTAT